MSRASKSKHKAPQRKRGRCGKGKARGESTTSPRRLAQRDRHLEALKLRRMGMSYRAIAAQLGYKDGTGVFEAVHNLLIATAREPADDVRQLEVERLDAMLEAIAEKLEKGDLFAIDRALKIQARRAALQGLDLEKGEGDGEDGNGSFVLGLPGHTPETVDDWTKLYTQSRATEADG